MTATCSSCKAQNLQDDFEFCPYCGDQRSKLSSCHECGSEVQPDMVFCHKCGTQLTISSAIVTSGKQSSSTRSQPQPDLEPPPTEGITIEFPFSTASSFDFALEAAQKFSTFRQYKDGKKAIYRVNFPWHEMAVALDLIEYLKGWRRRTVYVNGEKLLWKSVFDFVWCYERKESSYKPEFYCFGYDNTSELNIWGCMRANLPFTEWADWCKWGRWLNQKGDWEFDKPRIQHELEKRLYNYRFCPALQHDLVQEAIAALPEQVNPNKNKNWEFVQSWDDNVQGLVFTTRSHGYVETITVIGVAPNGVGALREVSKGMKGLQLPSKLRR